MKSLHFWISLTKSAVRIVGLVCGLVFINPAFAIVGLLLGEVIGVLEEFYEK